jgi:DnaJ-class molecular chaperone
MSDAEFEEVVDEYFFEIVDRLNYHVQHVLHPVLKLPINSDMETVKKKFRELAKEMHPDTGGSIEEFLALYEAYELFKRKRY